MRANVIAWCHVYCQNGREHCEKSRGTHCEIGTILIQEVLFCLEWSDRWKAAQNATETRIYLYPSRSCTQVLGKARLYYVSIRIGSANFKLDEEVFAIAVMIDRHRRRN